MSKPAPPPGHEKFRLFLERNDIGPREAAKALVGVTHAAVISWREGKSIPGDAARGAIEVWTDGEVAKSDWVTSDERELLAKFRRVTPFEPHEPEAQNDDSPDSPPATGTGGH